MDGVSIENLIAPEVDKSEILRYLGVKNVSSDYDEIINECLNVVLPTLKYSACYKDFLITADGNGINLGFTSVNSHSLAVNLSGCDKITLFCVSLGMGIDRLIEKYSALSPSKAVVIQAIGAERVEALCDALCAKLTAREEKESRFIRPRFSPGFGDFPLNYQAEIFRALDCGKIGVTLNKTMLVSPSKSVTALVGSGKRNDNQ